MTDYTLNQIQNWQAQARTTRLLNSSDPECSPEVYENVMAAQGAAYLDYLTMELNQIRTQYHLLRNAAVILSESSHVLNNILYDLTDDEQTDDMKTAFRNVVRARYALSLLLKDDPSPETPRSP